MTPVRGDDGIGRWPKVEKAWWCKQWLKITGTAEVIRRQTGIRPEWEQVLSNAKGKRMMKGDFIDMVRAMHKGKSELKMNAARMQVERAIAAKTLIATADKDGDTWISLGGTIAAEIPVELDLAGWGEIDIFEH